MRDVLQSHHCSCGAEVSPTLKSCPACHRLVHADALKELSVEASACEADGQLRLALAAWRDALDLLPAGTTQYAQVQERVVSLSNRIDSGEAPGSAVRAARADAPQSEHEHGKSSMVKVGSILGAVGLLLFKFKAVLIFLVTKAKFLLLGLGKSTTLFSMLLSLGVYWSIWGWKFALGVVLSIYVHEMGHVAALRHFGIRATAPMFIPGIGAVVRLHQHPQTKREDARIGLAGPIWGMGASFASYAIYLVTDQAIFAAIGQIGAWINLFNLLPVWQLDGGRGFQVLSRTQRILLCLLIGAAFYVSNEGLLLLLLIGAGAQVFSQACEEEGDGRTLFTYATLLVVLTALTMVPVPGV